MRKGRNDINTDTTSSLSLPSGCLFIILSGPSGVGKDAILQEMRLAKSPYHFVITATTRPQRDGEEDGVDYYFLTTEVFTSMKNKQEFLEYSRVYNNWYGVPKEPIENALKLGKDVVIKTDVQGVRKLQKSINQAIAIFLAPPNMEELEHRLRSRKSESERRLRVRLQTAAEEMQALPEFDYVVVNHNHLIKETVATIESIMVAERCRTTPRAIHLQSHPR